MNIIGIDVSQDWFDACVRVGNEPKWAQFSNNGKGRNELHKWLKKHDIKMPQLFMEATGRYGEDLAVWAHKHDWQVTIINPRCIRKFAESRLQYNKTDKLDSFCILRFAEGLEPGEVKTWKPKSHVHRELTELHLEIAGLEKIIGQERNRLQSGLKSQIVKRSIRTTVEYLKSQKENLEKMAIQLIKQDPELFKLYKILKPVIGFGDKTIITLLAKVDFARFRKGRQLVAFAGIAPRKWSSGSSVRKRESISRVGHATLRNSLYFPAVVAMTHDPLMAAFKERLEKKGKAKKAIICAVMATLLRKAFALVRDASRQTVAPQLKAA